MLAIVPARSGSKGIPDKNIRDFCGKPLMFWTIQAALKTNYIDRVVLSSDSEKYLSLARGTSECSTILRPASISGDDSSSEELVLHCLEHCPDFDWFVLLQPTSPLRTDWHIDKCFELLSKSSFDGAVSVSSAPFKPNHTFSIDQGSNSLRPLLDWESLHLPRQKLNKYYLLNGAIYICNSERFKENRKLIGPFSLPFIMDESEAVDIDSYEDFYRAEELFSERIN